MAGFDLDAQRSGTITGFGMIEAGHFDFSSGTRAVDVPTRMTNAVMGFAIAQSKSPGWQGLVATTDGDVSNGAITFDRASGFEAEDLRVHYLLLGF